ncbi:MAG TPA: twin-arginine translocase TatA/TatE family subunit [Chthoniobacteraceae bacterium]|jgi:Sec-independent protein translocase protein TatA
MNLASFGNFLGFDTLIIVLVILFFVGGAKIPEVARGVRGAIREFRKAKNADDPKIP